MTDPRKRRIGPAVLLLAVLLCAAWPGRGAAQAPGDAAAIEGVISDQIAAFQRGDEAGAFAFASPGIRGLFGSPQVFGEMVRSGYPMIWRPRERAFVGLAPENGGLRQTVLFVDAAGRLHVADYHMIQVDGAWRIDGVTLRGPPGAGA